MELFEEIREVLGIAWNTGAYSDETLAALTPIFGKIDNRTFRALAGLLDDIETWRQQVPAMVVDATPSR